MKTVEGLMALEGGVVTEFRYSDEPTESIHEVIERITTRYVPASTILWIERMDEPSGEWWERGAEPPEYKP